MNKLTKLLLPLAFLTLPLTSQAQEAPKKSIYTKVGISFSYPSNEPLRENYGSPTGYNFSLGKEIKPELFAEISESMGWSKKGKLSSRIHSIGPTVIWSPTFGDIDGIYFGGGLRFKSLKINYKGEEYSESDTYNGLGFAIKFGTEWNLGPKAKLYLETEYDQAKTETEYELVNLGSTSFNIGIRF